MTTPDIILTGVVTLGLGIISWQLRAQAKDIAETKTATIENTVILKSLPIAEMKADIKSNRHKIANVDKANTELAGRVGALEKAIDSIRGFCRDKHGGNI